MVEKLIGVSPYTGGIIFFYSSFFSMINLINLPMCRILSSYKEHTNLPISTRIFKFDNPNFVFRKLSLCDRFPRSSLYILLKCNQTCTRNFKFLSLLLVDRGCLCDLRFHELKSMESLN